MNVKAKKVPPVIRKDFTLSKRMSFLFLEFGVF